MTSLTDDPLLQKDVQILMPLTEIYLGINDSRLDDPDRVSPPPPRGYDDRRIRA